MAQVMVNFRMDENIKKNMEQACREMGLSMTTAFTIFATKVGKEKRIPFEITADPCGRESHPRRAPRLESQSWGKEDHLVLAQKQERLETLCGEIRRSLTAIHTAIPSAITGLTMERIRLLCGDELKDKAAGISRAAVTLFSDRNAEALREKDLTILEEYLDGLSAIGEDIREIGRALIPAMKAWTGEDSGLASYEERLTAVSQAFDELDTVMQRFWRSSTRRRGSARTVRARVQQAAVSVKTAYVLSALENLETLILRQYDSLDYQTKAYLDSYYLQTLERTLEELGAAERSGGDTGGKAALCLRAVNVISGVISDSGRVRRELSERSLEAEVTALERLAAMRGDIADGLKAET